MTFDEYQYFTETTAIYPLSRWPNYLIPGLAGEVGELCSLFAKEERDGFTPENHKKMRKELGDILWFMAQICSRLGLRLEEVAIENERKLKSRMERGTLQGSGDNR